MGQWSSPGNYQKEKELAVSSSTTNLYVKSEASETISSTVDQAEHGRASVVVNHEEPQDSILQ